MLSEKHIKYNYPSYPSEFKLTKKLQLKTKNQEFKNLI